ncbi:hypothetical protein B0H10DRAFT_2036764 [Mycena sp. CBHHK59/15]|nr:hypothetical protein B0H10DRAFT_2036764 [Mycena sp. CBHHK59/15]
MPTAPPTAPAPTTSLTTPTAPAPSPTTTTSEAKPRAKKNHNNLYNPSKTSNTARTLCGRNWKHEHPNGTTGAFDTYYKGLSPADLEVRPFATSLSTLVLLKVFRDGRQWKRGRRTQHARC